MSCSLPSPNHPGTWLIALSLLAAGCGGDADLCALASSHVEACTGLSVEQAPDTCDPEQARRVLGTDCAELAAAASRGAYWNLFDFFGPWGQGQGFSGCSIAEYHNGYKIIYHCPEGCNQARWKCTRTKVATGDGFPWSYGD